MGVYHCFQLTGRETNTETKGALLITCGSVDDIGENLVPRPSRWNSDTVLHIHCIPQRLVSLLPIILSRKHECQQELLGGLQRKHATQMNPSLGTKWQAGVQVVWSQGKNQGEEVLGIEPGWEASPPDFQASTVFSNPTNRRSQQLLPWRKIKWMSDQGFGFNHDKYKESPLQFSSEKGSGVHFHATYVPQ